MVELIPLVAIISIFVVLPGMAMFYADRKRRWQHENAARPASSNNELIALAEKMERRIDALEQILDAESPGWRKKYHEHS
jgi:phage shock protein B